MKIRKIIGGKKTKEIKDNETKDNVLLFNEKASEVSRKKISKKNIFFIFIGILVIVITLIYQFNPFKTNYNSYKIIHTSERNDTNAVNYMSYNSKLLKYSRDGLSVISSGGTLLWNATYEMKNPIVDMCEDYIAVADMGNKQIYVFDSSGENFSIDVQFPIRQIKVANQGVVVAILEDIDVYYIKLYDKMGKELVGTQTFIETNGYPLDIALSNDALKLITSYFNINNSVVENSLSVYRFDKIGKNQIDNLIGGFLMGQTIIPKIEFITNDIACAFGDNKIVLYVVKQEVKELKTIEVENEIKSILYSNEYVGYVSENYDGVENYQIQLYDLQGNLTLNHKFDFHYDNIYLSGDNIIMYNESEVLIVTVKGKTKFAYTFDFKIEHFYPTNKQNKFYVIEEKKIKEIKLVEE